MKRRVVLSLRAEKQVEALYDYIFDQSGEKRADLVIGRLLQACYGLDIFPFRGTKRDDVREGLRVMGFRRQASIAFIVEEERVVIHGIFGRGQDLALLLEDENKL
jgi:toxin ParE1/3/4